MRHLIVTALLFSLSACFPALVNKPVQFAAAAPQDDLVDTVVRALAANGQTVTVADHQLGIVQSRWENTGFGYGFVDVTVPYAHSVGAQIWRRYTLTVVKRDAKAEFNLRADTQRCQEGATTIDGVNVNGVCTTLYADGLVPDHQEQLEALGAKLKSALGGS